MDLMGVVKTAFLRCISVLGLARRIDRTGAWVSMETEPIPDGSLWIEWSRSIDEIRGWYFTGEIHKEKCFIRKQHPFELEIVYLMRFSKPVLINTSKCIF